MKVASRSIFLSKQPLFLGSSYMAAGKGSSIECSIQFGLYLTSCVAKSCNDAKHTNFKVGYYKNYILCYCLFYHNLTRKLYPPLNSCKAAHTIPVLPYCRWNPAPKVSSFFNRSQFLRTFKFHKSRVIIKDKRNLDKSYISYDHLRKNKWTRMGQH